MVTGWVDDPYGRHEARWISSGSPTALVRDGGIEQSDPVPADEAPSLRFGAVQPAASSADSGLGDSRVSSTRAELSGRVPADTRRPPSKRSRLSGRRRQIGVALILLGVCGLVLAYQLGSREASHPIRTQPFVPTPAELNVRATGGTRVPPTCPAAVAENAPDNELALSPISANTAFTVYPDSLIGLFQGQFDHQHFEGELSDTTAICALNSYGASETQAYYLEKPGTLFVYYLSGTDTVRVAKIVITTGSPPSTLPGSILLVVGALLCIAGIVLVYRKRLGPPDDLRLADDAERSGDFDPDAMQRAAWDAAIDQTADQY